MLGVKYIYVRRHEEDHLVVPYNPEVMILWGAAHVKRVSRHGFEMYLAKYISKPEPSTFTYQKIPDRYLRTRVTGAVKCLDVLVGFTSTIHNSAGNLPSYGATSKTAYVEAQN